MRIDKDGRIYCEKCGYSKFKLIHEAGEVIQICIRCSEPFETDKGFQLSKDQKVIIGKNELGFLDGGPYIRIKEYDWDKKNFYVNISSSIPVKKVK